MAQHSKVFFPYDPLPAQDLNDIVDFMNGIATGSNVEDGAISPNQRSGGHYIQTIPGSSFGSSTTFTISGVPFAPKMVIFDVAFSFSTTTGTTALGRCTDDFQFFVYSALSSANQRRGSATSSCIGWDNASGSQSMRASRVSLNEDGITMEVQVPNNSFDVMATFLG